MAEPLMSLEEQLLNEPVAAPDDPGGAHAKGYSTDGTKPAGCDPVPLAPAPADPHAIKVPERDNAVTPTGRAEPGDYTPNDRLTGADR